MMEELEKRVDKYINEMETGSNEEKFSIDKIESQMGEIMVESRKIIVDKTSELLKNIDEEKEITKKKRI